MKGIVKNYEHSNDYNTINTGSIVGSIKAYNVVVDAGYSSTTLSNTHVNEDFKCDHTSDDSEVLSSKKENQYVYAFTAHQNYLE